MNVSLYKCSILVVDDNPAILSILTAQLSDAFEVMTSGSVHEARMLLALRSVDIVMTDLKLPDEPGLSLLDWVRSTSPRTARILITGTARLEDAADAINQTQIHRLILKPWRGSDLLQSLLSISRALLLERSHEQLLDELRELNLQLEQRVNERTRELEIALAQIHRKNQTLEKLALTDPLTGLPNRRAIELIARKEVLRRSRTPSSLAIVLLDVDHFKEINTHFTLPGGDHVLVWLAGVLQGAMRALDSLGRFGGEEFLVVAPNTDSIGAAVLAERLRTTIEFSSTQYNGRPIRRTISLGLAIAEEGVVAAYDELRDCAASALQEAKDTGRNRAVIRSFTS